jgi:hypothetical protein
LSAFQVPVGTACWVSVVICCASWKGCVGK